MKHVGFILLAVVVLAVAAFAVLIASLPAGKVTIRSVGPTASSWSGTNYAGEQEHGVFWQFAITNTGGTPARWTAYVRFKEADRVNRVSGSWAPGSWAGGVLLPGQGLVTALAVPTKSNRMWSGVVVYEPGPSPRESKVLSYARRFPGLSNFFPSAKPHTYCDVWRTITNGPANADKR